MHPISVVGEPFVRVAVDIVSPLPRTKTVKENILTMIFQSAKYPEAIDVSSLKSRAIVSFLVKMFGRFAIFLKG